MPDTMIVERLHMDHADTPRPSTGRHYFNPERLFEALIDAVLPLLTEEGDLMDGKTDRDVVLALKPVIGDFTLEEAIYLYAMLGVAEAALESCDLEDCRWNALLRARWILRDFVSNAYISGPKCAVARGWLAEFHIWENERAGSDDQMAWEITHVTRWDVRNLRDRQYHGDRFFAEGRGNCDPRWFSIMNVNRQS